MLVSFIQLYFLYLFYFLTTIFFRHKKSVTFSDTITVHEWDDSEEDRIDHYFRQKIFEKLKCLDQDTSTTILKMNNKQDVQLEN